MTNEANTLPYGHARLSDGTVFDMTAHRMPAFGLLTDEEQAALRAHGGPWEFLGYEGNWLSTKRPAWWRSSTYCVAPKPPAQAVTVETVDGWVGHNGGMYIGIPHPSYKPARVTITDGKITGIEVEIVR